MSVKFPPRTSRTTEIRLASATASRTDETSITPKQMVSAKTMHRCSFLRSGAAGAGCGVFFFSSRRRHTRSDRDWSSDVLFRSARGVDTIVDAAHSWGQMDFKVADLG